jgi:hypothetical protein
MAQPSQSTNTSTGIPQLPVDLELTGDDCRQLGLMQSLGSVRAYFYPICQGNNVSPLMLDCTQQSEGVSFTYSAEYTEVPSQCQSSMMEYLKRNSITLTIMVNYLGFKDPNVQRTFLGLEPHPTAPNLLIQDCAKSFRNRYFSILLVPSGNAEGNFSGGMLFPWARFKFSNESISFSIDEPPKYTYEFICTCAPIPRPGKQDFLVGFYS